MKSYILILIILGAAGIALPWLTRLSKFTLINVPIVSVLLGMLLYSLPLNLPNPDPLTHEKILLKLSELAVIISLMGAGLKLSRKISFKAYKIPLLLVFITMIGCIAATAGLSWLLGFAPAVALLLGAVFAPTDPVIAEDVQVEVTEDADEEHPVQFSLTAEAGMNDGLAFPFTWLAVWMAMKGWDGGSWLSSWFLMDFCFRIVCGVVVGAALGFSIAWLHFSLPSRLGFKPHRLGFLAIASTFLVYGIAEAVSGYGFIAVFVAAVALRRYEKQHDFHKEMHDVITQMEHFFIMALLILLGGYFVRDWLSDLRWPSVVLSLVFLFFIRPIFGLLPTIGSGWKWKDRLIVAFMGIKGIGSVFYLSFALHEAAFVKTNQLWATVAFLILVSLAVHGVAGYFIRPYLDAKKKNGT